MNIVFISAEVAPFSKTGGLADVTGSLPKYLHDQGHKVLVLTPAYSFVKKQQHLPGSRVKVHFIESRKFFFRSGIYGNKSGDFSDNHLRFEYFSKQSLEYLKRSGFKPDIIHCHDWHTGLVPAYLKTEYAHDPFFKECRSVFTIHNLAYQGLFENDTYKDLELFNRYGFFRTVEFWGKLSFIKSGLIYSDLITAVSPSYAREIRTRKFGCGLDEVIKGRGKSVIGVLNGIDTKEWNPESDRTVLRVRPFDPCVFKKKNKARLLKSHGLKDDGRPVIGMVTRLAEQKGFDLIEQTMDRIMKLPVQFVLLGTGDPKIELFLRSAARRYPGSMSACIGFDAASANQIYAGSDFFMMPSRFEPCGLGQLIAFRYGALPIAHETGGLKDTIRDLNRDPESGTGFLFSKYRASELLRTIERAVDFYRQPGADHLRAVKRVVKQDFSWTKSAAVMSQVYLEALRQPRTKIRHSRSIVIGLTGLSGSGKSTVREVFRSNGSAEIDSDTLAHQVLADPAVLRKISSAFNRSIPGRNSKEIRNYIRRSISRDPALLTELERVLHPIIREQLRKIIADTRRFGGMLIVEVPLLFETGMDRMTDRTICVTAGEKHLKKIARKRGWSESEYAKLTGRQLPASEKIRKADLIIRNYTTIADLKGKAQKVFEQLKMED